MNRDVGAEPANDLRIEAPNRFQLLERGERADGQAMQDDSFSLHRSDATQPGKLVC